MMIDNLYVSGWQSLSVHNEYEALEIRDTHNGDRPSRFVRHGNAPACVTIALSRVEAYRVLEVSHSTAIHGIQPFLCPFIVSYEAQISVFCFALDAPAQPCPR
jgi:hypothetical protein